MKLVRQVAASVRRNLAVLLLAASAFAAPNANIDTVYSRASRTVGYPEVSAVRDLDERIIAESLVACFGSLPLVSC